MKRFKIEQTLVAFVDVPDEITEETIDEYLGDTTEKFPEKMEVDRTEYFLVGPRVGSTVTALYDPEGTGGTIILGTVIASDPDDECATIQTDRGDTYDVYFCNIKEA